MITTVSFMGSGRG